MLVFLISLYSFLTFIEEVPIPTEGYWYSRLVITYCGDSSRKFEEPNLNSSKSKILKKEKQKKIKQTREHKVTDKKNKKCI